MKLNVLLDFSLVLDPSFSTSNVLRLQMHVAMSAFYVGTRDQTHLIIPLLQVLTE